MDTQLLDNAIRRVNDFPKPGILFYDITSLLTCPKAFGAVIEEMYLRYKDAGFDAVAAIESRGFIFGAPLAERLGIPLVLIRKKGKLPGEVYSQSYALEYGSAELEVHKADVKKGDRFIIVDDLIATGGTVDATRKLLEKAGAKASEVFGVIGLPQLNYQKVLSPMKITTLINYDGK
ncbi:adenine phosphoribosyltransferase [Treponema pectinovorum]|uniref:adenine phosphoribosyltransferase n=1 Tax=Treponema pectinovorum TaxID=164 RepID=UPI003D8F14A3